MATRGPEDTDACGRCDRDDIDLCGYDQSCWNYCADCHGEEHIGPECANCEWCRCPECRGADVVFSGDDLQAARVNAVSRAAFTAPLVPGVLCRGFPPAMPDDGQMWMNEHDVTFVWDASVQEWVKFQAPNPGPPYIALPDAVLKRIVGTGMQLQEVIKLADELRGEIKNDRHAGKLARISELLEQFREEMKS